jgi:hypothetical protein
MSVLIKALCGSDLRARVLTALWSRPTRALGLHALSTAAGTDPSNTAKILPGLVEAGLCERTAEVSPRYRAAQANPSFLELASLFSRHASDEGDAPLTAFARRAQEGLDAGDGRAAKSEQQHRDYSDILSSRARADSMRLIPPSLARTAVVHYRDVEFDG